MSIPFQPQYRQGWETWRFFESNISARLLLYPFIMYYHFYVFLRIWSYIESQYVERFTALFKAVKKIYLESLLYFLSFVISWMSYFQYVFAMCVYRKKTMQEMLLTRFTLLLPQNNMSFLKTCYFSTFVIMNFVHPFHFTYLKRLINPLHLEPSLRK